MINSFIIGRLGADAEVKTSKNGNQFLSMRVASNDYVNGENATTWVNVVWGGERAIKMAQHMKKGSMVSINGPLRTSTYTTKSGENAVSVDVFADRVDFVNSGNSGQTQSSEAIVDTGTFKKQEDIVTETPAPVAANSGSVNIDDLPF